MHAYIKTHKHKYVDRQTDRRVKQSCYARKESEKHSVFLKIHMCFGIKTVRMCHILMIGTKLHESYAVLPTSSNIRNHSCFEGGIKKLVKMTGGKLYVGGMPDIAPNATIINKTVEAKATDIRRRRRSAGTILGVTPDGRPVSSVDGDMTGRAPGIKKLASSPCGLDSSTDRAADRYPESASSNPPRVNIFRLTSSVSDCHEKFLFTYISEDDSEIAKLHT